MSGREMVAQRPVPGEPRPYEFPTTFRTMLGNGLRVIVTPMPGRELIAASLALRAGAVDEPADVGGATVLAARGLTEGTEVRDAIAAALARIGAALAKRQLYLTISELFKRFPNVELAEEPERDGSDHNAVVFKRLLLKTNCR